MSFGAGVGWSLAGALANTGIDSLRKLGSTRIQPAHLVALVAVFDGVIATVTVTAFGGFDHPLKPEHPTRFVAVVIASSYLLLLSKFLYQKALHLAPLSLTVPYLAFTPAILVAVAFIVIGETPTPWGAAGVTVVALGGYLLGRHGAPPASVASSPSKTRLLGSLPGGAAKSGAGGGFDSGPRSIWAVTFYKHKRAMYVPSGDEHGHGSSTMVTQLASAKPGGAVPLLPVAGVMAGGSGGGGRSSGGGGSGTPGSGGAPAARQQQLLGSGGAQPARLPYSPSARLCSLCWRLLQLLVQCQCGGPALVLVVAAIWSLTASLDKIGIGASPSMPAYFVAQRLVIGLSCLAYLLISPRARPALRHVLSDFWLLFSISLLEQSAVLFFLMAIQNMLVSYVVAIKRINVLFSTLVGALLFKESVCSRLPYIMVMLGGMLLIVLQPGHELLHHSHHT